MVKPKISIIIPVYNVEKYLRRCLDSVLNQTFQNWTAICVDDGSPDNSGKIADEYAKKDKRFIVIHQKNGGLSVARNTAMKYVKTKYVMYLDSDDFIHPQTMEIVYNLAEQNNVDIVSFEYQNVEPDIKIDSFPKYSVSKNYKKRKLQFCVTENEHKHSLLRNKWVKHCIVVRNLYKYSFIHNIQFIPGIIMEDFPWWNHIVSKKPIIIKTDFPLYYYVNNINSITNVTSFFKYVKSLSVGIKYVFDLYDKKSKEYKYISREMLWPFIVRMYQYAQKITDDNEKQQSIKIIKSLNDNGVFDYTPDMHARRYKHRILKYITKD
ncbi:MAG: glycosyltransferase [Alphaproteobacteria bacterium]|nr:glycosyltransferase [Alphaproteobacteria bacterium]